MRRSGAFAFILGVFFVLALIVLNRSSISFTTKAAAQQSGQAPKIVRSSVPASVPTAKTADLQAQFAPPGTEFYSAKRGDSVGSVARQYLKRTSYLTSSELAEAIVGLKRRL